MSHQQSKEVRGKKQETTGNLTAMLQQSKLNLKDLWLKKEMDFKGFTSRERGSIDEESLRISPMLKGQKPFPEKLEAIFRKFSPNQLESKFNSRKIASHSRLDKFKTESMHIKTQENKRTHLRDKIHQDSDETSIGKMTGLKLDTIKDELEEGSKLSSVREREGISDRYIGSGIGKSYSYKMDKEINLSDLLRGKKLEVSSFLNKNPIKQINEFRSNYLAKTHAEPQSRKLRGHFTQSATLINKQPSVENTSQNYDSLKQQIEQFEIYLETATSDLIEIAKQRDKLKKQNELLSLKNKDVEENNQVLEKELLEAKEKNRLYETNLELLLSFVDQIETIVKGGGEEVEVTSQSGAQPPLNEMKTSKHPVLSFDPSSIKTDCFKEKLQTLLDSIQNLAEEKVEKIESTSPFLSPEPANINFFFAEATPRFQDLAHSQNHHFSGFKSKEKKTQAGEYTFGLLPKM